MAIKAQKTQLNVVPGGIIPVVHVSQYDVGRTLTFVLYDGNTSASLATGTTAVIEGTKPDGHGFQYSATISGNEVTVNTTQQMTIITGTVDCKIVLSKGSQVIGTALFIMDVEKAGINESTDISETDLPLIIAEATEQMERAEAAATAAALSETHAATSETNAATSETNAAASEAHAATSETNAAASATSASTDATSASTSATNANRDALKSEGHAVGQQNGTDVSSGSPYFQNNAKYYAQIAEQYAQGGLIYKGSVLFANIPTTGMSSGDLYNIEDDFTTDSRFQEGAGILVKAGADIAWNGSKWDVLATSGVTGVKGNAESTYRTGDVNLTPANLGALATNGDGKNVTVTYTTKDDAKTTTEKTNSTTDQPSTVAKLASGETLATMFGKISAMFKNVRRLWNTVGTTNISNIAGSTLTEIANNIVPVGTILSVMTNSAPTGYLLCDGSTYNISNYTKLANHFNTQFGSKNFFGGNGTTTFKVPDLRGEFIRGAGTNSHSGQGNGGSVGEHQDATTDYPFYWNGSSGAASFECSIPNTGRSRRLPDSDGNTTGYKQKITTDSGQYSSTSSYWTTSRPTNTSVLYCIKY